MRELSSTKAPETVTVTATVIVTRQITITAFGADHAKELATDQARKSHEAHEWTLPDGTKAMLDPSQVRIDRY